MTAISEWVYCLYNPEGRHSIIGSTSPVKYELAWRLRQKMT